MINFNKIPQKKQAILCILSAALCFAFMNLFVKLGGDLPVWQKCFFRNFIAFFIALGVTIREKEKFSVNKEQWPFLIIRCVGGTLGILFNFYAIGKLNIADASMLNKLSPFFAIIFSIFISKEKPKKIEWITVIIAFIGALFIIKPTFNMESFPAFTGFLGGMCAGLAYACVRKLGNLKLKGSNIVLAFSFFSCFSMLPLMAIKFEPMTLFQLVVLLMAGVSAAGGQFSITAAYSKAPAKEISVFDYIQVIFAAILSLVFLGDLPDYVSFIGYAIIIGVAVWKWNTEK